MMRRRIVASLALMVALGLPAAGPHAAEAPGRAQASWWVQHHGVVTEGEDPRVLRANRVFQRVAAAADKRGNRLARLIVIRGAADPFAAAIEDGSIVLTRSGLGRCYDGASSRRGDARLAFVLGHELAHLAKDDFWHVAAFAAIEAHLDEPAPRSALLDLLRAQADVGAEAGSAQAAARLKEVEADSYGLVYMMMAGYDPSALLAAGGSFLEDWTAQVTSQAAYESRTHPSPEERAAFLRAQLDAVAGDLDFFYFGVRLLQLGRHDDAILFLRRFAERFPSREVYSDLGLAHYQLAVGALHRCDPQLALRFRLATELDATTVARGRSAEARSGSPVQCLDRPDFRSHLQSALSYLEHAVASDPSYVPARINLASAHVLGGEPSKALGILDDVDRLEPGHPGAANNRAIALYLFGRAASIDTMDQARGLLAELIGRDPHSTHALYNLGVMDGERGRNAAAQEHWRAFLAAEPAGPWADRVRERLGSEEAGSDVTSARPAVVEWEPPLPLGVLTDAIESSLSAMDRNRFRLGIIEGEFVAGPGTRALVLEEYVEIVEAVLDPPIDRADVIERHGAPGRVLPLPDGELLVWSGFALEIREERATRAIHFESGAQ